MHVAALEDVIASKEWAGRPKDIEALPELRSLRSGYSAKEAEPPDIDVGPAQA